MYTSQTLRSNTGLQHLKTIDIFSLKIRVYRKKKEKHIASGSDSNFAGRIFDEHTVLNSLR